MERLKSEIADDRVIRAMEQVPRESFVPAESKHMAYEDAPVPIGEGQTISQPFIVALMVQALELRQMDKVLEVGTGSGYEAAVLAEMASRVVTVERIASLADSARERLASLGYGNVEVVLAGEKLGWEAEAPYDAIVVAAAAPKLLRGLMEQMADAGRLVIPVGSMQNQELMKVSRSEDTYSVKTMGGCRFVPLIGEDAWPEGQGSG